MENETYVMERGDSKQYSNQLNLMSILVNFSCELGHIVTIYDFLEAS